MAKTCVNGIDLYYETQGTGEALLLIAGFACDHTIWALMIPALAARYRVISFDNRGLGQSSGSENVTSIRQMADDAAGLLDALGIGSAHVTGHSMGGLIAQELAVTHPQRVQSLLLLSTCAQVDERGKAITDVWAELPRVVDAATMNRLLLPWMYTSAFYAKPGAIERLTERILAYPFPPSTEVIARQCRAIAAFQSSSELAQLACPTGVFVGREDILIPVALSEQLVRRIPNAELEVLEETGHGMLIESPKQVSDALLAFLARH
ncbi:MAG TPA: alpha/beta hydrolase [Planctomycetaceae bacterium]|nr:alpha/beta hydrolase [Planctomycetaceae bacterium]